MSSSSLISNNLSPSISSLFSSNNLNPKNTSTDNQVPFTPTHEPITEPNPTTRKSDGAVAFARTHLTNPISNTNTFKVKDMVNNIEVRIARQIPSHTYRPSNYTNNIYSQCPHSSTHTTESSTLPLTQNTTHNRNTLLLYYKQNIIQTPEHRLIHTTTLKHNDITTYNIHINKEKHTHKKQKQKQTPTFNSKFCLRKCTPLELAAGWAEGSPVVWPSDVPSQSEGAKAHPSGTSDWYDQAKGQKPILCPGHAFSSKPTTEFNKQYTKEILNPTQPHKTKTTKTHNTQPKNIAKLIKRLKYVNKEILEKRANHTPAEYGPRNPRRKKKGRFLNKWNSKTRKQIKTALEGLPSGSAGQPRRPPSNPDSNPSELPFCGDQVDQASLPRKRNSKRGFRSTQKINERKTKRSFKRRIARNTNRQLGSANNTHTHSTKNSRLRLRNPR